MAGYIDWEKPDRIVKEWIRSDDKTVIVRLHSDDTQEWFYNDGRMWLRVLADGTEEWLHPDGETVHHCIFPDKTEKWFNSNGELWLQIAIQSFFDGEGWDERLPRVVREYFFPDTRYPREYRPR